MTDRRRYAARAVLVLAGAAALAACAPPRRLDTNANSVRISYLVAFEGARATPSDFQERFEAAFARSGAPNVSLNINPLSSGRVASRPLRTVSYLAALDNAHAKAEALAQHAGVRLGALRSVTEQGAASGLGSGAAFGGEAMRTSTVGVTLTVVYDISGGGIDRGIAVLGSGSERTALPVETGPVRELNVSLNSHAAALADAQRAVAQDEALLRQTAASLDRGIRITRSDSSLDAYR